MTLDLMAAAAIVGTLLLLRGPAIRLLHVRSRSECATPLQGVPRPRPDAPEDELLAALHDELWPNHEWMAMELDGCPRPQLDGYSTEAAARAADTRPYALPRRCACGQWHVYLRRRRHWRAPAARRGRRR
ncbi:hypothetical protein [Nonomuraea sp. CA-141351]|uniref:hypothetical protein n=1 Tax=Nonomuraea sp. CA-141351 TaxID=3239996 RepID=UPI003D8D0AC7